MILIKTHEWNYTKTIMTNVYKKSNSAEQQSVSECAEWQLTYISLHAPNKQTHHQTPHITNISTRLCNYNLKQHNMSVKAPTVRVHTADVFVYPGRTISGFVSLIFPTFCSCDLIRCHQGDWISYCIWQICVFAWWSV